MTSYLIAETAFHHEGDKEYLLQLVDAAYSAGADSIKFQILIDLNEFMSSKHGAYHHAKKWVLTYEDWVEVLDYTVSKNLDLVIMPLDSKAFTLVGMYDVKYLEIHSVSFKDDKLLSFLDSTKNGLIFGVGGRTEEEIDIVVNQYRNRDLVLMVGFQSFPTVFRDSQIEKIRILKERYPCCKIGYADHSPFDDEMAIKSSEYAYIFGATVLEKHLTIDEGKERIDFQSAIGVDKFKTIKENVFLLSESISHNNVFTLSEREIEYRNRQKIPVTSRKLKAGTDINKNDLVLKMIDSPNGCETVESLIGRVLKHDLDIDVAIGEEDLV